MFIFSPCFILSLGSKHHGIPEWHCGREPRGTRCRLYPSQNLSRLWASGMARLSPISTAGSLSPPWACAWNLSWLLHPASLHKANILRSVHRLCQQVLVNVKSPTTHVSQERCSLLPTGQHQNPMDRDNSDPGSKLGQAEGTKEA